MNLEKYKEHYERMLKFLEQPLNKDYEPLLDRMEKLGILLAKSGSPNGKHPTKH